MLSAAAAVIVGIVAKQWRQLWIWVAVIFMAGLAFDVFARLPAINEQRRLLGLDQTGLAEFLAGRFASLLLVVLCASAAFLVAGRFRNRRLRRAEQHPY